MTIIPLHSIPVHLFQRLDRLTAGIVELPSLPNLEDTTTQDENLQYQLATTYGVQVMALSELIDY